MVAWNRLAEIVDQLYAVAEGQRGWNAPLQCIVEATGSAASILLQIDARTSDLFRLESYGAPSDGADAYKSHYVYVDPRFEYLARNRNISAFADFDFIDERGMSRHEYYEDFLAPQDMRYFCGTILDLAHGTTSALNIQRSPRQGHPDSHHLDFLLAIKPHLERAHRLSAVTARLHALSVATEDALNYLRQGVLILGGDLEVILMNRAARRIVNARDGLEYVSGRIVAVHREDHARLQRSVADACQIAVGRMRPATSGTMSIRRPAWPEPLAVLVLPVRQPSQGLTFVPFLRPVSLLLVSRPEEHIGADVTVLRETFDLTMQEARVAQMLAAGKDVPRIEKALGISRHTLRGYLKAIFSKTMTSRQAELVSKVLALGMPDAEE